MARWPRIVRLTLQSLGVAACLAARPAVAADARDLAGWWIAVDRVFPRLYEEVGLILPMDELLVIDTQARVENRFMMFFGPYAEECRDRKTMCSDAPATAYSRITVADNQLTFSDSVKPDHRIESAAQLDSALRALAVTSTASWTLSREANGQLLVLHPKLSSASPPVANIATRMFARIEPDRLRRLRALFLAREISAVKHWRCFLANATSSDPAFAPLRNQPRIAPKYLDEAAKVASYYQALAEAFRAIADERDPERRKLAGVPVETVLTEQFADLRKPATLAERIALEQRFETLVLRVAGQLTASPGLPLTDGEIEAFIRATGKDPEAMRLFCMN
jgi:hypothetical protein